MIATDGIKIESLVRTELPPLPRAAMRVAELTKDVTVSNRVIADTIGSDPVLAVKVLRAANSPLYARERPILTLPAAVAALGNHALHMLVIVLVAFDFFHRKIKQTAAHRVLWEHSVITGLASREICHALGLRLGDQAFLSGLLHDIGRLLLLCHDGATYAQANKDISEQELLEREREAYGYTHAEVGEHVADYWKLPKEISSIIRFHHHPEEAGEYALMAYIVDAADALSNSAGVSVQPGGGGCCDLTSIKLVADLGISDEQIQAIWKTSTTQMHEMGKFFS